MEREMGCTKSKNGHLLQLSGYELLLKFFRLCWSVEDLVFILAALLETSRKKADSEPTPASPPSAEWSNSADLYVIRCASEGRLPSMTPEVAAALIPRIVAVIPRAEKIAESLDEELKREASGGEVLKRLLLTEWHSGLREEWMRGERGQSD